MSFIVNFPFFSIILAMFSGIVSSALNGKWAKRICIVMLTIVLVLSACVLFYTVETGEEFTYMMGHFPAPWGNEIRAGVLEGFMATFLSSTMSIRLGTKLFRRMNLWTCDLLCPASSATCVTAHPDFSPTWGEVGSILLP